MVTDLVCGASIDEQNPGASFDYRGHLYYFCASDCKDKFVKAPRRYIKKAS